MSKEKLTEERKTREQNSNDTKKQQPVAADHLDDDQMSMEDKPEKALEEKSATKIQAGVRGFLVRKRQQAEQAAATRIQAGFRGFRTRKLLKQNGQ